MPTTVENNKISLNVTAPTFNLVDVFGKQVNLEAYRGKKVFVGFFRHAGCPFCNLRVHTLMKQTETFKQQGLEMIFFFESDARLIVNSSFLSEVAPIPIISDPKKEWYAAFGLEDSFTKAGFGVLTNFIKTSIKAAREKVPNHYMKSGESFGTMPAEFLLDENLIIRELHYSQHLNDRLSMESIQNFIK